MSPEEIVRRISDQWPLEPVAAERADSTARRWRYLDGAGEVGVIGAGSRARGNQRQTVAAVRADGGDDDLRPGGHLVQR